MTSYRAACEFDVIRRIGWSDDELAVHVDEVFERLRQASEVTGIDVTADLDSGRITIDVDVESWEPDRNTHARTLLSVAIRAANARHENLLSLADESALMSSKREGWSALRGATWSLRRLELEQPGHG